ncbi:hypothetical protein [Parasitella parasitica]|uniref:E3 ubiquitin-protein ligase n=1 Tax=Parasitella parasitica TaxID=35722 RepID=A0A0B7MT00_9FUNG|nr:hypothetical protein [Parasitella parasitica]
MSQHTSTLESFDSSPITPAQLKTFLTEAPLMYKSKLHRGAQKQILTNCYRSLWSNDLELMQRYFFQEALSDSDNLSHLLEKYNLFGSEHTDHDTEDDDGDDDDEQLPHQKRLSRTSNSEPEYWESQRGNQCGHLFKKGESVYRCRNCGLDDTCVMCSKCFHSTNHDGHDVKIWISRGAGGCCDCGDPEAWKVPLVCAIHSLDSDSAIPEAASARPPLEPLSSVPASILQSVRDTITVVADYLLETFATSPEDVVSVGTVESIEQDCIDSHNALGLPAEAPNQTYACILWNDEKHSFDSVINIVVNALGCTKDEAAHAAECVDLYGRHIIKESTDIAELIRIAETVSSINLAVTICSSQKTVREEISGLLLDWLKELTGGRYKFFSNVDGGNCIIRDVICSVFSADWALRPELACLSTRYRRERMPEDENDEFDMDGADADMDGDGDGADENMMFDDMDEIEQEDVLLDEDQLDHFFNILQRHVPEDSEQDNEDDDEDENSDDAMYHDTDNVYSETNEQLEQGVSDMETDVPSTSSEALSRRRQSDAPSQPSISASNNTHQGRNAEVLKRRRLSASSQSKTLKSHKPRDILDMDWSLDAWLEYTERLEAEERSITQQLRIPHRDSASTTTVDEEIASTRLVNANLKSEFRRKLRLDYLLQFDLRLWKTARVSIKDLLIGTFISNFQYRPVLGTRFARNYPELVDAFFFKDREPENSVSTLSVQLLTVPTVASMLVKEYKFFGIVCSILENFFLTDHILMVLPEEYVRAQVDCSSRAIGRHRYAYTIFDLRYVMNAEQVKVEIAKNPVYLRHFMDMLYQFQEMDPLKRKADTHVEFESQSWVTAFNMTLQTSKLCRLFAGCFDSTELGAAEASRNLCRSIHRVLKEIAEWKPVLGPRKAGEQAQPDTRTIIKSLDEQEFHQLRALNTGDYEVVKYDITSDPVSFHHPFHWLLSELFENVSLLHQGVLNELGWLGGFKQMVSDAFDSKDNHDMFLMVLEYPLRTIALLSQINCGVWVRNGYAIRNQAHSYRDVNVRESTLDCDIYLLQVGLTVCDSNQMLLTLMDRFQLMDWFKGKPHKHKNYDASQTVYMVEDFLNLLIICATEHSYASGTKIEERVRQSIIQFLGISSMAYSELLKLVPESLTEHESFEAQLNTIANFKAPDGLSDKGLYEIKPEYVSEIEPFYWHYTRNQREEAQHALKKRWNQLHPNEQLADKQEFLLTPHSKRIHAGPFRHLGRFLHSRVLCQIIAYALWNSKFHKASKSDTILDEALYLAMLAVTDPNSAASELAAMKVKGKYRADVILDESNTKHFIDFAESDEYSIQINEIEKTHASLLLILLRCLDDADLAHAHKRLGFIVDKIEMHCSDVAKDVIRDWKERKARATQAEMERAGGASTSEYERKKAAAKVRQAAIMSQFANAQSKFMEKHADLYKTEQEEEEEVEEEDMRDVSVLDSNSNGRDDVEIVRKCHFPADTCIVCQEALDSSQLYGMLGLIQQANIHRLAPLSNKDVLADVLEASQHANPYSARPEASNKAPLFHGFPIDAHVTGLDISSCGHLMHSECFDNYQRSVENQMVGDLARIFPLPAAAPKSRFLCPLCKALGNVLVPIVWKGKKEAYPGVMVPATPYADLGSAIADAAADLKKNLEQFPGAFDQEPPFVSSDPDLVISDQDKLKHIYNQLIKMMHTTLNPRLHSWTLLRSIQLLQDMYAYTIADFEIAQRGTQGTRARDLTVEHTGTFIDDIPSISQTLLKILGMTNLLIRDLMNSPWLAEDRFTKERLALQAFHQFIPRDAFKIEDRPGAKTIPLLADDPFKVLVRLSFSTADDAPAVEIHHLLRSVYLAELTKTVIFLVRSLLLESDKATKDASIRQLLQTLNAEKQQLPGAEGIQQFTSYVLMGLLKVPQASIDAFFRLVNPGAFVALVRTFVLPFLRKSLLFMVVHHGFIPQNPPAEVVPDKSEFDSILDTLRLPALDDSLFDLQPFEQELVSGWCQDYMAQAAPKISLNLPTQFNMAVLPHRLDQLLDESSKRVCKKCKTVPEHSAICLICGTFVCARRFCCTEGTKGECNTHMKICGGEIGIYIMIKDCFLLLLHDNGGSIMNAPYLDSHGEADIFFKRGAPQFLNTKRYEQIRQMWLTQSVPAFVRRRMEIAYSGTVWEAF